MSLRRFYFSTFYFATLSNYYNINNMDDSLKIMKEGYPTPTPKDKTKPLKFFLIFLVVLFLVFFGFRQYSSYRVSKIVPKNLIEGTNADFNIVKAEPSSLMKITANETLEGESLVYIENKTQQEVLQDFYKKIMEDGWVAVDGTLQEGKNSIFKITDGNYLMFVTLEGGVKEPPTTVKIYKVLKNK